MSRTVFQILDPECFPLNPKMKQYFGNKVKRVLLPADPIEDPSGCCDYLCSRLRVPLAQPFKKGKQKGSRGKTECVVSTIANQS